MSSIKLLHSAAGVSHAISLLLGTHGVFTSSPVSAIVAACLAFTTSIVQLIPKAKYSIIPLLFNVSIFIFLIGRAPARYLYGIPMDSDQTSHTLALFLVTISLIVINSTFLILQHIVISRGVTRKPQRRTNPQIVAAITMLFIVSAISALIKNVALFLFARDHGYVSLYLTPSTGLPQMVIIMADMLPITFGLLLGTMPSKTKTHLAFIAYILLQTPLLLAGKRMLFISAIIAWGSYIYLRAITGQGNERWIGKWERIVAMTAIPIVILTIPLVGSLREGNKYQPQDVIYGIIDGQGVTLDVVALGIQLHEKVPPSSHGFYTTAPLVDYIKTNFLARAITGAQRSPSQSDSSATLGRNYADALSYVALGRERYLSGYGVGSSYIIESFIDFGVAGVVVLSAAIGLLLILLTYGFGINFWITSMLSVILLYLYQMPRGKTMDVIMPFVQVQTVVIISATLVGIMLYNKIMRRRKLQHGK